MPWYADNDDDWNDEEFGWDDIPSNETEETDEEIPIGDPYLPDLDPDGVDEYMVTLHALHPEERTEEELDIRVTEVDQYGNTISIPYPFPVQFMSLPADDPNVLLAAERRQAAIASQSPKQTVFIDFEGRMRVCRNGGPCQYYCNGMRDGHCPEVPGFTSKIQELVHEAQAQLDNNTPAKKEEISTGRKIIRDP